MAVRLEKTELQYVDFGRDEGGRNVVVGFPIIHRYEQVIAEVEGYDPQETGRMSRLVHYGYAPYPAIRIANAVSSHAQPIQRLELDLDGDIWLMCHRHASAAESAAYAHALMMARDPASGLAPAAIEYETPDGHYTISARRPPAGAPSGLIVYGVTHDDVSRSRMLSMAFDGTGQMTSHEAHLFAYVPLPEGGTRPRMDT